MLSFVSCKMALTSQVISDSVIHNPLTKTKELLDLVPSLLKQRVCGVASCSSDSPDVINYAHHIVQFILNRF